MADENTTLLEYINLETENKKKLPWATQIIQNTFSMAGLVPLRLYSQDNANKVWDRIKKRSDYNPELFHTWTKDWFSGVEAFNEEDSPERDVWVKFFKNQDNSAWVTRPSYSHPLIEELRILPCYRTWEHIYIHAWIEDLERQHKDSDIRTFLDQLFIGMKRFKVNGSNFFLIIGPVFQPPEKDSDESFEKERINHFLDRVKKLNQQVIKRKNLIDDNRDWAMLGTMRPWRHEDDLVRSLNHVVLAFKALFQASWPKEFVLHRCMCQSLAIGAWAITSHAFKGIVGRLESEYYKVFFPLILPGDQEQDHYIYCKINEKHWDLTVIKTINPNNYNAPDIEIQYNQVPENVKSDFAYYYRKLKTRISSFFNSCTAPDMEIEAKQVPDNIKSDFAYYYRNLKTKISSLKESNTNEILLLLLNRLRKQFGLIFANLTVNQKDSMERFCDRISSELASIVDSDVASIHHYIYSQEGVDLLSLHTDPMIYYSQKNQKIIESLFSSLETIKPNTEDRLKCMIYRVIDNDESCFCRGIIKTEKDYKCDPTNEDILPFKEDMFSSGICVPLRANDRILGVLGVFGQSPYQFRKQNVHLLTLFSQIVSPYLYRAMFISSMSQLTGKILNPEISSDDKYHFICEEFSQLFMSYGATLWTPDHSNERVLRIKGWTNTREDLKRLNQEDMLCSLDDPNGTFYNAFPDNNHSKSKNVSINNAAEWFKEKKYRLWLGDQNIKEITHIPVVNKEDQKLLAMFSLYYKEPYKGLDKSWDSIISFMSNYLGLLIEAMMVQEKWQQHIGEMINHELKQRVDMIHQRAMDIYKYFPEHFKKISIDLPEIKSPPAKIFEDLSSYVQSVHNLMSNLQDKAFLDKLHKGKEHPLAILHSIENLPDDTVSLYRLFNEIIHSYWKKLKYKGINYFYNGPGKGQGPYYIMPKEHLTTIMNNLIGNAVKYAYPRSKITVKVKATENTIECHVSNEAKSLETGEKLPRLFSEGVRGSNAKGIDGQGKGLFILKLYCQLYDGECDLEISKLTETRWLYTFSLFFPRPKRAKWDIDEEDI